MANLQDSSNTLAVCACMGTLIGALLHAIAMATNNWIVSYLPSPFVRAGFHEYCFDKCRSPYCPGGIDYEFNGCWWIYDYYFESIYNWIRPAWYMNLRNLVIINVPLSGAAFILTAVLVCMVCFGRCATRESKGRNICQSLLLFLTAVVDLASSILCIIVVIQLHSESIKYGWMPLPERNKPGFSYWLEVTASIALGLSGVLLILAGVFRALTYDKVVDPDVTQDMMMGGLGGGPSSVSGRHPYS